ncbi:hypothetical protein DFH27DRAFT_24551 [Peziza echinospora]|nr:hypothetical protein DFH27DRAFT_24551 [Peziza echinospora]
MRPQIMNGYHTFFFFFSLFILYHHFSKGRLFYHIYVFFVANMFMPQIMVHPISGGWHCFYFFIFLFFCFYFFAFLLFFSSLLYFYVFRNSFSLIFLLMYMLDHMAEGF